MKKTVLMLAMLFAFSTAFTSCREDKKVDIDVEETQDDMEDGMEEVGNDIEDAANDAGDAMEEAANETGEAIDDAAQEVEDEIEGNDDM